jgi:hypothetical protein
MSSLTSIKADIRLLPTESGGRRYPASGRFPCWVGIGFGFFETVIDFTSIGNLPPDKAVQVPVEFQTPNLVLPLLRVGCDFKIWENSRTIGFGKVIEIC